MSQHYTDGDAYGPPADSATTPTAEVVPHTATPGRGAWTKMWPLADWRGASARWWRAWLVYLASIRTPPE